MERTGSTQTAPLALSQATLSAVGGRVPVPTYDRTKLRPSIVHLGVGGFHRASDLFQLFDHVAPSFECGVVLTREFAVITSQHRFNSATGMIARRTPKPEGE